MAISVGLVMIWICGYGFLLIKKRLSFLQNFIVLMMMWLLTRNVLTILTLQLNYLETTSSRSLFLFFLFYRDILIPLAVLIFANAYLLSVHWFKKIWLVIITVIFLQTTHFLTLYFEIIQYIHWNHLLTLIMNIIFIFAGLWGSKLVLYLQLLESRQNENSL